MTTVHCVDVSGSMCTDNLEKAHKEVLKRFKPKDVVVFFSVKCHRITDIERPFTSYSWNEFPWLMGGTDAEEVLEFAQKLDTSQYPQNLFSKPKVKTILYSDGYLTGIDRFDEFVEC